MALNGGGPTARRPRLLIVTPDYPPERGGVQLLIHRTASGIGGFETMVIAPDSPGATQFDRDSTMTIERVGAGDWPRGARIARLNAAAVGRALRFRPDITLSAHIVVSPAAAAIRRMLGARTCQYFYAEEIGAKPKLATFAAHYAHESVAPSAYSAGLVADAGALPAKIKLIPPGVDIPNDATPQASENPTFLTIARLEERYKGHDVMMRALPLVLAKVPSARWVVIGDGSLRAGLEQLAQSHGVADSISFLGAVSDEVRNLWLRRAQLLVMPSRLPAGGFAGEGFGIVFLEAGAYGKPVVAGNVGGALDAVADNESGLLVDPTDPVAVADAIASLLLDRELASRLGDAGKERAQRFAWPTIVERVERMLRDMLEPPPPSPESVRGGRNGGLAGTEP